MRHRRWLPLATGLGVASAWTIVHRRSPAVRQWYPSALDLQRIGHLTARIGGACDTAVLLLHGLVSAGDVFAITADEVALRHRVAVPDLLGFGRSLDESSSEFGTVDHLAAIDPVVERLDSGAPLSIGARSMGCALALRYATSHPDRVRNVVCLGAPIRRSPSAARDAIGAAGPMTRVFLLDETVAERICRFNCAQPGLLAQMMRAATA